MVEQSRHGYLILADISGYTSFLAKVELEHANEILTDLLEVIMDKFQSLLTISKLEGMRSLPMLMKAQSRAGKHCWS